MKKVVCTVSAALLLALLAGCAMDNAGGDVSTPTPVVSTSPMIVTPDPDNGRIEDGDGKENGTVEYPSASPAGTASASPAAGKRS